MGINEDQDWREVIARLRGSQNLETIALWEAECGENDLEEAVVELLRSFNTIAGLGHIVPLLAEEIGKLLAQEKVWLGDEDGAHASYPITWLSYLIFPNDRDRPS
jgi:hypothetical protein